MINLKSFVDAIHEAIISANNALMDKNIGLLDKFFDEVPQVNSGVSAGVQKTNLVPKNVVLEYPTLTEDGKSESTQIHVPLITMVPLGMSQIEKATLTAEFELALVNDELQVNFPAQKSESIFRKSSNNPNSTTGKLEIIISPQEPAEGLKMIVEAYEATLKRQIS